MHAESTAPTPNTVRLAGATRSLPQARRRTAVVLAAAALAALALAGCTPAEEQEAATGVSLACTAAGVGSTIAVAVATKGQAATISQQVGQGVSAACPLLVSGVTAAVNQLTAQGQTATVTVTTTSPKGKRRSAQFKAARINGEVVYTIPPNPLGFLGL